MKAHYKVSDRLSFEIEADDQKEIFRQLAIVDNVFGENVCPVTKDGKNSNNIIFIVRQDKQNNEYFEKQCTDPPYARLKFGQHRGKDTLFPRRKKDDGSNIGTRGWEVFKKKD